ncbi:MAG: hypothetical protein KC910_30820 [Candidatus Eremiobacteraeota bacterium]|nr:hypothetical protein [Candidatus Eremiobacteraeota bacterium]
MKRLPLLLLLVVLAGCGERRQVQTYLGAVAAELPVLKDISRQTEDAFDDLRFGARPDDLGELAGRLDKAADGLDVQVEALKASRARAAALPAPGPAKEFEARLLACYDRWAEVGQQLAQTCRQAATSCREVETSSGKDKLKRFGEASRAMGDKLRELQKAGRDAGRASQDVQEELQRLQKRYKLPRG